MGVEAKKRGPCRTKWERRRDTMVIATLKSKGWSDQAIGDHLGLTKQMIGHERRKMERQFQTKAANETAERIALMRARLHDCMRRAIECWDWSRAETVRGLVEQVEDQ